MSMSYKANPGAVQRGGAGRMMQRWNPARKSYEPYHVPDSWKVSAYEDDMDKVISCASCGKDIAYGDCYTSRQIHTAHGFGYMVCGECYEKEWREEAEG